MLARGVGVERNISHQFFSSWRGLLTIPVYPTGYVLRLINNLLPIYPRLFSNYCFSAVPQWGCFLYWFFKVGTQFPVTLWRSQGRAHWFLKFPKLRMLTLKFFEGKPFWFSKARCHEDSSSKCQSALPGVPGKGSVPLPSPCLSSPFLWVVSLGVWIPPISAPSTLFRAVSFLHLAV